MNLSKEHTEVLKKIAAEFGACYDFLEQLDSLSSTLQIKRFMIKNNEIIASKLGIDMDDDIEGNIELHHVLTYLNLACLSDQDRLMVLEATDLDLNLMVKSLNKDSLLNSMKAEIFLEILDEITLADMEALYAKHKPNAVVNPQQMKLVV